MARIELSNIGGGGTTLSLTTTGTSGASTLAGSVLNIPVYQGQLTLTTTGTSGAATLSGTTLNIPNYATGGSPAGSAGQVQFNSTPAGSFAASANLAWDNTAVQLNIGAPLSPTGKLNVKGSGATSLTVNTRLTDSGNTELLKVLDNGSTNIGANFNWDNTNSRLGIGTASPSQSLHVSGNAIITGSNGTATTIMGRDVSGNISAINLTTTGTSGAATLSGNNLNIPQYSGGGGGTPAGSTGEIQYNNAGAFAASSNLAWDNSSVQLNVGAPSAPTGKLNVKGSGTLTTVNTRLTDSGNTELFKVLDNGNTNIGTGFNWDNTNNRLGIGFSSPAQALEVNGSALIRAGAVSGTFVGGGSTTRYTSNSGINTSAIYLSAPSAGNDVFVLYVGGSATSNVNQYWNSNGDIRTRGSIFCGAASGAEVVGALSARLTVKGSNTSSGTNALLVQNNRSPTPDDIYKIENDGKISYLATNTAAGTTGAQTINRPSGTVNFGIGAGSLVVTNSLCSTSSIVFATVRTNDATAYIKNVVPAAGSFTINLGAAATAETSVGFFIIN